MSKRNISLSKHKHTYTKENKKKKKGEREKYITNLIYFLLPFNITKIDGQDQLLAVNITYNYLAKRKKKSQYQSLFYLSIDLRELSHNPADALLRNVTTNCQGLHCQMKHHQ